MKTRLSVAMSFLLCVMSVQAYAEKETNPELLPPGQLPEPRIGLIETHDAIETASLRMSLGKDMHGFIEGKKCDNCKPLKVTVTPDTKAYQDGKEVPLKKAKSRIGRFATVIFERETKNVSAIRW